MFRRCDRSVVDYCRPNRVSVVVSDHSIHWSVDSFDSFASFALINWFASKFESNSTN